jgi:diamine N-acetyltransferase
MPIIQSKRIRFRAPERSDISRFVGWLSDPEVTAGLLLAVPMGVADEERWFEEMIKSPLAEHPMTIEARQEGPDGESWTPIGSCSFHKIDWRNRHAELGIVIGDKRFWNRGFGTDAMRLLVKHGFKNLNFHRIYLHVHADNPRAIRCYEKVGFKHEGRLRADQFKNGIYIDTLVMSILDSEYQGEDDL